MDLRINVFDYPCTPVYRQGKAPVLSFSRVSKANSDQAPNTNICC